MVTTPQQIKPPARIVNGPQIQAGPFVLPAGLDLTDHKIYLRHSQWKKSRAHKELASWAVDSIWQVSQNHGWNKPTFSYEKNGHLWARDWIQIGPSRIPNPSGKKQFLYPKWDQPGDVGGYWVSAPGNPGEVRGVGQVMVPPDQVWGVKFFTGKKPIAKFKHPVTKKEWGVYCLITGEEFLFTFKRIEKSWLGKLWDWLKSLPSKLIEFVSDVIDFFKGLGCALARTHLDTLSQLASGQLMASASVVNPLLAVGVSMADIENVEQGVTAAGAEAIANKVIDKVCGPPPPTPPGKQYPPGAVQAFDPSAKTWIIAAPKGGGALGGALGTNPDTGKQYEIVERSSGKAVEVAVISLDDLKKWLRPPWYKSPWFWGGVAVLGVGGYFGYRKFVKGRA
jgi:hypothetical protein